jgi:hypothetical protein
VFWISAIENRTFESCLHNLGSLPSNPSVGNFPKNLELLESFAQGEARARYAKSESTPNKFP